MTEHEKKSFTLNSCMENDKQLPEITYMDPVSRVIFLKPGEV